MASVCAFAGAGQGGRRPNGKLHDAGGQDTQHRRGHPAGVRGAFTGEATGGLGRGGRGGPEARRACMFLKAMMKNWDGPYEGHEADNISSLALFYEDRSPLSQRAWTLRCRARRDPE